MNYMICFHEWSEPYSFKRTMADGSDQDGWWKHCRRCQTTWYDDRKEPDVILGLIVDESFLFPK